MKKLSALFLFACLPGIAWSETVTAPHVEVEFEGISAAQATALADTASAAWAVYTGDFGFKMPDTLRFQVTCGPQERTRLYTDGKDSLFLFLAAPKQLDRPAQSGVFNLYGTCHELGHIAMYRILENRDWMSGAAAEGWAHYAGSVVVDQVYAAKGEKLWADPYDYRADGTARLDRSLNSKSPSDVDRAAGQWRKLEKIIGRKALPAAFTAWQQGAIDATKPSAALLEALTRLHASKSAALTAWWKESEPLFVEKTESSGVKAVQISPAKLTGRPVRIAEDDDSPDGRKSIAGGGHARRFETPGPGDWYLRAVWVHGGRYGPPRAPATTFDVALCDTDLKPISIWKKPIGAFRYGDGGWTRIDVLPTRVPKIFQVCLNFRPTASNGVRVSFDGSTTGHSLVGIPGKPGDPFGDGDWMIRVELDQPKDADALRTPTTAPK